MRRRPVDAGRPDVVVLDEDDGVGRCRGGHGARGGQRGQAGQKIGSHGGQHPRRGDVPHRGIAASASLRSSPRDRALHPPRDRSHLDGRGEDGGLARVEVAAAEELGGADARGPRGDPRRDLHGRGGPGARADHRPRRRRVRRRARRERRAGRPLDPLRPDVLRRARHRARAAAPRRRRIVVRAPRATRALVDQAREHVDTVCTGRTHGVHAEPTTFGIKLAGYAIEAHRNAERLERAFDAGRASARSAAPSAPTPPRPGLRAPRPRRLGLRAEPVSTQVVPRDRHAEVLQAIALAGAGLERFATEIRHLQRTEVREVEEPFRAGPEGLERDAAQAQPDHDRADHRPLARPARLCPGRASRTSHSGTSATSRTPVPSA